MFQGIRIYTGGLLLFALLLNSACAPALHPKCSMVLYNGVFFTADTVERHPTAIALAGDRIIALGADKSVRRLAKRKTEQIDLKGAFVMPGLIEGHGHFVLMGKMMRDLNLLHTTSWEEIGNLVAQKAQRMPKGAWLEGRGWHQEKWTQSPDPLVGGYPNNSLLNQLAPHNPVILYHASGHALIANEKALAQAGITDSTPDPAGGHIVRDASGKASGALEENAMDLLTNTYNFWQSLRSPAEKATEFEELVQLSTRHCWENGITSFQDAGSTFWELEQYKRLAETGKLGVRIWAMILQPGQAEFPRLQQYPQIGIGKGFFTARAVKAYLDGALGSYGAWLLAPYADKPDNVGQILTPIDSLRLLAAQCRARRLQLCVHAIGDRANREVLNLFDESLPHNPQGPAYGSARGGLRWRIEHAQNIDPQDMPRFAQMGVIASMQAIHCTSDAPFVEKRLGATRARTGAYAWRSLLDAQAKLANGTDTPVEELDPFACLYAAITRKRTDTGLEFYPEQKMTRTEALNSYTRWNAYAAFEEQEKGVIAVGKLADLTVVSVNLLECNPIEFRSAKVLKTIIAGKVVFAQ